LEGESMERTLKFLVACSSVLFFSAVSASAAGETPYAGMQKRNVKALSEQQIADLKAGRGMTFALAAELNGYPGPTHVLENAFALNLSDQQRAATQLLLTAMKEEAIPLGTRLIAQEAALDQLFASKAITATSLDAATQAIGMTQANLRKTHLKYHLSMMNILLPAQISRYRELRGYTSPNAPMKLHEHEHGTK
jgi:hypothetical protein